MVQTLGTKSVNLVAQIALAWLQAPEDFDLIALVLTITTLLGLLRDAGMRDVLVRRHRNFGRWAGAAFWLSLVTGFAVGILTIASIPVALAVYKEPALKGLLIVSAIGAPINTLGTVSDALLRSQMRFRLIAIIGLGVFTGTSLMTVFLAWLGWGAYAWVVPQPIMWLVRAVVLWWVAKPNFSMRPRFRRWKYLIGDNLKLLGADLAISGTFQGDRAVLGAMFPETVLAGIYFFAINLTAQSIRLFVTNVTRVLFPALSKLQDDPQRQVRAFLRATSLLALVGTPLCLVQVPLAEPLMVLVFQPKWYDAIPVVQLLAIGMIGRLMTAPSRGMIMAQGRFGVLLTMSIINAVSFIGAVVLGAIIGGEKHGLVGVAVAAAVGMFLYGPVQIYVAARPGKATWLSVGKTYAVPLAAGTMSMVASWAGSEGAYALLAGGSEWFARLVQAIVAVVLTFGVYTVMVMWLAPDQVRELKNRVHDMLAHARTKRERRLAREAEQAEQAQRGDDEAADEIAEVENEITLPGDER